MNTESDREASPGRHASGAPTGRGGRLLARAAMGVVVVSFAAAAFGVGFLRFAHEVAFGYPERNVKADGIVVLTGGRDRIQIGMDLLHQRRARRLLISGVHRSTTVDDIRRATESRPDLFACCVDLGHDAETTVGNAAEAARWAEDRDFRSLIVVTSAYHMPRSLRELERSLPNVALKPFPVRRPDLEFDRWYARPATMKLLLAEYVKYMLARLRLGVETIGRR